MIARPSRSHLLVLAMAVGGLCGCEQRFSATPPPLPPEPASESPSGGMEALLGQRSVVDAGSPAPDSSHAMSISTCSQGCPAPEGDASLDATYRVVFGSGRGVIRSREQAMTDLYRELRDRIDLGEQLAARPRRRGDAGAGAVPPGRAPKPSTPSSDALAQAALRLLDVVDDVGEMFVDVIHDSRSDCALSLGLSGGDGGASQCLINEPEHQHSRGRGGIGF